MDSTLQKMQEMLAGQDSRLNRLRAEIESAEKERADTQTAIRIYIQVTGSRAAPMSAVAPDDSAAKPLARPPAERRAEILNTLGTGRANGRTPAQVFKELERKGVNDIAIDTLRTALWRLAKKDEIQSADSYYWKFEEKPENLTLSGFLS